MKSTKRCSLWRDAALLLVQICFAGALLGTAGCTSASTPQSPHPYDFVPGPDDTYVQNQAITLAREYWVIYRQTDGTHYMFPRPDGEPLLADACAGDDAFAQLLADARACYPAGSTRDVARINALSLDEATQISTYLHERLLFEPGDGDTTPHALISDTIDVCRTFAEVRQGVLVEVCDRELAYADGGSRPSMAYQLTAEEVAALAASLNELYGIAADTPQ